VREEESGLGNLASDFDFCQAPLPPLILPTHPASGPASNPPGSVPPGAPEPALSPCPAPPSSPSPPASAPSSAGASSSGAGGPPLLQITASVASRQDMRLHHGRVYLLVGCNEACSIYAHGHLNLLRHHRHLGLRSTRATLAANQTVRIALSLSRSNLAAVRRVALAGRYTVKAAVEVQATGADGKRQDYQVVVVLSWR